jgi:hypothetical protein
MIERAVKYQAFRRDRDLMGRMNNIPSWVEFTLSSNNPYTVNLSPRLMCERMIREVEQDVLVGPVVHRWDEGPSHTIRLEPESTIHEALVFNTAYRVCVGDLDGKGTASVVYDLYWHGMLYDPPFRDWIFQWCSPEYRDMVLEALEGREDQ